MNGLYIHIPFCDNICNYCDFYKKIGNRKDKENYIIDLLKELNYYKEYFNQIDTIYIGGGTPGSLDLDLLERLLKYIVNNLNMNNILEYTIEANINDINIELINLIKQYKVNRISIGIQSFNNSLLKLMNRNHSNEHITKKINLLKDNNFNNINVDLIYGLPTQSMDMLNNDLDEFIKLDINHISIYSLILEEKTVFHKWLKENKITLLDDDLVSDMYEVILDKLANNGFMHYEISNFAKDGYTSLHNLKYWSNIPYIGVGLGASGYLDNIRYDNPTIFKKYHEYTNAFDKSYLDKVYIDKDELLKEYLILGLRKMKGINVLDINKEFNINLIEKYNINKYIKLGLMEYKNDYLKFSVKGILLSNSIFTELL